MTQEEINTAFNGRWHFKGRFFMANQNFTQMSIEELSDSIRELCKDFFVAGIEIAGGAPPDTAGNPKLAHRQMVFQQSLFTRDNMAKYGQQMLQDFHDYWSEPNKSNTKMRFELQKTWDLSRRLARWARNNYNRYDRQSSNIQQQRIDKLVDIING